MIYLCKECNKKFKTPIEAYINIIEEPFLFCPNCYNSNYEKILGEKE